MANQTTKYSALMTVAEVSKLLICDDTTVRRWIKQGVLDAVILPSAGPKNSYRIRRSTIEEMLGESLA